MKFIITFNTLATPHKGILHNQKTDMKILNGLQKRYISGVGSLLYLVKYEQTELFKVVCELSKIIDE